VIGKSPFIECDDPIGDLVGCCGQDHIAVVHLFFSARDVGKQQHSAHRRRRIDISVEQLFLSVGTAPSFIEPSKHALDGNLLAVRLLRLDHSRAHQHASGMHYGASGYARPEAD
jgi:hypothetical protein